MFKCISKVFYGIFGCSSVFLRCSREFSGVQVVFLVEDKQSIGSVLPSKERFFLPRPSGGERIVISTLWLKAGSKTKKASGKMTQALVNVTLLKPSNQAKRIKKVLEVLKYLRTTMKPGLKHQKMIPKKHQKKPISKTTNLIPQMLAAGKTF